MVTFTQRALTEGGWRGAVVPSGRREGGCTMAEIVAFTDNIRDLSNEEGYQFEFVCERCGNGYRSPFQADMKEKGRGFLRAATSLLGDRVDGIGKLSNAASALDRGTNSAQKDKAMKSAVDAVKD